MDKRPDFAIVLTGTIVPNIVGIANADASERRAEYLEAVQYYRQFAPVYFLENSSYPLLTDPDFAQLDGVALRKFAMSQAPERGKGFQEFGMLDEWVKTETASPARFLKITGRYRYLNFPSIVKDCLAEQRDVIIIDQYHRPQIALSQLFFVSRSLYERAVSGISAVCDDRTGQWIERLLYSRFAQNGTPTRLFRNEPWLNAISGSTGGRVRDGWCKHALKATLRRLNRVVDRRTLYGRS
jgi:hypothetical protein